MSETLREQIVAARREWRRAAAIYEDALDRAIVDVYQERPSNDPVSGVVIKALANRRCAGELEAVRKSLLELDDLTARLDAAATESHERAGGVMRDAVVPIRFGDLVRMMELKKEVDDAE